MRPPHRQGDFLRKTLTGRRFRRGNAGVLEKFGLFLQINPRKVRKIRFEVKVFCEV
jgi:hypothetical protein